MDSSKPAGKSGPPVRIRCRDQEHIARELRRRASSDSLFIPSEAPADAGATQEFLFYVPDGPEVRVEAEVLQSIPPAPGADMPGMLVSFKGAATGLEPDPEGARNERRVRAARTRAAIMPGPRASIAIADPAENARVLEALEAELAALEGKSDRAILGLEADADEAAVRGAFAKLADQYDTKHFERHGSQSILECAARIAGRMRGAHDRLVEELSSVPPDAVHLSMTPQERRDPIISDAAALITGEAFVEAQRVLSKALQERPGNQRARLWLLIAQARQAEAWKDYETAKARYRAALAVDHSHPVASKGLARAAARGAPGPLSQPRMSMPARASTRASGRAVRRSGKP